MEIQLLFPIGDHAIYLKSFLETKINSNYCEGSTLMGYVTQDLTNEHYHQLEPETILPPEFTAESEVIHE